MMPVNSPARREGTMRLRLAIRITSIEGNSAIARASDDGVGGGAMSIYLTFPSGWTDASVD